MRLLIALIAVLPFAATGQHYQGQFSANPYVQKPAYVNPYDNSLKLYDQQGQFRGNLNNNPYDADSIANPHGRYGSKYSSDSINNPYGRYGSQYSSDSPNNPYGQGLSIYSKGCCN